MSVMWPRNSEEQPQLLRRCSSGIKWRCFVCGTISTAAEATNCSLCFAPRELDLPTMDLGKEEHILAYFDQMFEAMWDQNLIPTVQGLGGANEPLDPKSAARVKFLTNKMRNNGYEGYEYTNR